MKKHNIVFAGAMAAILLNAGAANAAISIASQGYVDKAEAAAKTYTDEEIAKLGMADYAKSADVTTAISTATTSIKDAYEAADAQVLTDAKAYVDEKAYDDTELSGKVEANTTKIGTADLPETYTDLTDAVTKLKTKTDGMATTEGLTELTTTVDGLTNATGTGSVDVLEDKVATLETTVGDATDGLVADVAANTTAIATNAGAIEDNAEAIAGLHNDTGTGTLDTVYATKAEATYTAGDNISIEGNVISSTYEYDDTTVKADIKKNADDIAALDTKFATDEALTTVEGKVDANAAKIGTTALPEGYADLTDAVVKLKDATDTMASDETVTNLGNDVDALQTAVGDANSGLVKDVADLKVADEAFTAKDAELAGDIAENATAIDNITKEGGAIDTAITEAAANYVPISDIEGYEACISQAPICVWGFDKTSNDFAWIAVTPDNVAQPE